MPIAGRWTRLGTWAMTALPKSGGVYELANVQYQVIFIGSCENLDLRLHQHLYTKDPCLSRAWHFRYEEHLSPPERARELLEEHRQEHGVLPDCQR